MNLINRKQIFLVEDQQEYINWYKAFFKTLKNIDVFIENTGDKGLEMIKLGDPDLIILDYNLPGKNGIEICKELRKIEKFKNVPIIVVSSSPVEGNKEQVFLEAGFTEIFEKPLYFKDFKRKILNLLN